MPTNPLASITDYETFIYGLPDAFPPDIKRRRGNAPGLSSDSPNLPFLVREIEQAYLSA